MDPNNPKIVDAQKVVIQIFQQKEGWRSNNSQKTQILNDIVSIESEMEEDSEHGSAIIDACLQVDVELDSPSLKRIINDYFI